MTEITALDADDRQQGGIQVIARMSSIMRVLSAHSQSGMSLAAIAAEVDLPRSTVQRIITALVSENIVEPAGPTGFRIGPALGQMLYQTHSDIMPVLKPHVEQLSLKLQETVCLARMQKQKLHMLEAIIGEQVLRIVPPLGVVPPLQITAAGKALLARMDDAALEAWMASETADTASHATIRAKVAQTRAQGYAMDVDEVIAGVGAIAVSIGTYRGAYALMILAPSVRLTAQLDLFRQELFSLRDGMEKLLGTPVTGS
jgi:DNA-binding IclR family transcriptional regulator